MTIDHPAEAAEFLRDPKRAKWHDESLWFVRQKRDRIAASIPEWEALRQLGSDIKLHTLSRLDQYLEQFEAQATANGIKVHWARDGAEHNEIVHGILDEHKARRVVKSKSMLTEECHLNPHLEAAGIEVTDTDLGEYIVQLRKEAPSHIVLPAIHLRKREIGELFHEKIGTEAGSEDADYLTEQARHALREKFLAAEAGITGVNFAVAETGGIVVCTNEGNANLGVALPPLHIACMGIEKVIPRLEHLGVFLRLLARSATGQPITSYSTHFHGPRPGCEMHIVLVDNRRSILLGEPDFHEALKCIRCGACMNTCPIYRRSGGHSYGATVPGPIGSVLSPNTDLGKYAKLPFASSLCGSCTDVCPVRIPLHEQLLAWRKRVVRAGHLPRGKRLSMKFAGSVLSKPWLYRLVGRGVKMLRWLPRPFVYNRLNAWGRQRDLPVPPKRSFREQMRDRERKGGRP